MADFLADFLAPGGGNEVGGSAIDDDADDDEGYFTGAKPCTLRRSSHGPDPRNLTLPDGTDVKWCSFCGYWGENFRLLHMDNNEVEQEETGRLCEEVNVNLPSGILVLDSAGVDGEAGILG